MELSQWNQSKPRVLPDFYTHCHVSDLTYPEFRIPVVDSSVRPDPRRFLLSVLRCPIFHLAKAFVMFLGV